MAKAKTINLLLEDGTLDGLITMADSQWNSGELYSVPRAQAETILSSDAVKKFGVYLLLSQDMVYVGQASDLSRRIKQHIIGKDWWERVIVLTTTDDSLNRSDIDYLESVLIQKAAENNRLDSDNKNKGNKQKVTKFREVELQQYLEEALFLLKLIGIDVFDNQRKVLSHLSLDQTPVLLLTVLKEKQNYSWKRIIYISTRNLRSPRNSQIKIISGLILRRLC